MSSMLTIVACTLGDSSPRDKQAVRVEVVAGDQPSLPAFGAAQRLDGLLDELAVSGAARLALSLAEPLASPARRSPGGG